VRYDSGQCDLRVKRALDCAHRSAARTVAAPLACALLLTVPAWCFAAAPTQSPPTCAPSTLAGGYCGDGGPATAARLAAPRDVAAIPGGGELIADSSNFVIRQIKGGLISTVAGVGVPGTVPPAQPTPVDQVALSDPRGVAALPDGSFAIADAGLRAVLLVGTNGTVRSLATATSGVGLRLPVDVVALGDGTLAVVDQAAGRVVRLALDGRQEVLASGLAQPVQAAVAGGSGPPLQRGLFVAEAAASPERPPGGRATAGDVVRVGPGNSRAIVAGPGALLPAAAAMRFDRLGGVAAGVDGSLLVADTDAVQMIGVDGNIQLVAGGGQPASSPVKLYQAAGIAYDAEGGMLLVADPAADQIKRVRLAGVGPGGARIRTAGRQSYGESSTGKDAKPTQRAGAAPVCRAGSVDRRLLYVLQYTHRRLSVHVSGRRALARVDVFSSRRATRRVDHAGPFAADGQTVRFDLPRLRLRAVYYFQIWARGGCLMVSKGG
jgi:hypothetical protein